MGADLAEELAAGGKTPLWDALDEVIVQEREGPAAPPADAVVVVRTAEPQQGQTRTFLAGVYAGLARAGVPAVGTEASAAKSAIPAFELAGLSTVDSSTPPPGGWGSCCSSVVRSLGTTASTRRPTTASSADSPAAGARR